MKFLDLNGVATLWNKIKSSFIPYNPSGVSLTVRQGEYLIFQGPQISGTAVEMVLQPDQLWNFFVVEDVTSGRSAYCTMGIYPIHDIFGNDTQGEKRAVLEIGNADSSNTRYGSNGLLIENPDSVRQCEIQMNKIQLYNSDADIIVNGESIIPQAIEDSWLNSNLT